LHFSERGDHAEIEDRALARGQRVVAPGFTPTILGDEALEIAVEVIGALERAIDIVFAEHLAAHGEAAVIGVLIHCYLETESEVSCGSPDFDLITEISDAVCEPGCGFGRVATGEVFGPEVLVVSAVTQHVVDRRQDRRGHRDGRLLGTAACFETQELSLQIAILLARCPPGGLQQHRLEPWRALFDPRRAALAGALVKARNEPRP